MSIVSCTPQNPVLMIKAHILNPKPWADEIGSGFGMPSSEGGCEALCFVSC